MPLWGVGEYRDKNLSQHRSGSESVEAGQISTNDVFVTTCTHGPAGASDPDHVGFFYHVEPPMWQIDSDRNKNRQKHMTETDLGHATGTSAWITTDTSGPANATHTFSEDPMGVGITLESNREGGASDHLSQTIGRGGAARSSPAEDGSGTYPNRLTGGSRGVGYHYEYEYIDSSGNHRRRFEQLVATREDLTNKLDPDVVSVDWNQSTSTTP